VVLAAVIIASAAPVLAAQEHPVCAASKHDCGKTARLTRCCCGDHGNPAGRGGPTESRVQVTPQWAPLVGTPVDAPAAEPGLIAVRANASPPRTAIFDLPTLLATLLI
jgi:hypothetical protein